MRFYRRGFRKRIPVILTFAVTLLFVFYFSPRLLIRDIGYLTRPIWDTPGDRPKMVIPHFHSTTLSKENLCRLHTWTRRLSNNVTVIDATMFSIEIDLLEIRLKELWDVVDTFIVVEADRSLTGHRKPLILQENLGRFQWAKEKLEHVVVQDLKEHPGDFENEAEMRKRLADAVRNQSPKVGDLIIESDVDEIPYKETIQLLKSCQGYPREMHLEMKNYLYSFDFAVGTKNWKPHVTTFDPVEFRYRHDKLSDTVLVDSGWHCSFCFRYLSDFVFKMTSYSHADRVTGSYLTQKANIQRKICNGEDIFEMLPEAYTFRELFTQMGRINPSSSTFGIPKAIMEDYETFKFLLPGGCIREDNNSSE